MSKSNFRGAQLSSYIFTPLPPNQKKNGYNPDFHTWGGPLTFFCWGRGPKMLFTFSDAPAPPPPLAFSGPKKVGNSKPRGEHLQAEALAQLLLRPKRDSVPCLGKRGLTKMVGSLWQSPFNQTKKLKSSQQKQSDILTDRNFKKEASKLYW